MVKLISPAPGGTRGLAYGNTTVRPYSSSRPHRGQDWEREWRDLSRPRPVVAPVAGRVSKVYSGPGYNDGWGRRVEITVPASGVTIVAALNHLESVAVHVGQDVAPGEYIGEMGDSGETAGVHLHEELWINGVRVDPNPYRSRDLPGTATTAGGGSRPFDPEEDDVNERQNMMLEHLFATLTPGIPNVKHHGEVYNSIKAIEGVVAGDIDRAGGAMGGKTNLRALIAWYDQNNIVLRQQFIDATETMTKSVVTALAKVPGVDPKVVRDAIAAAVAGSVLDPNVIGKAVAADLAKRLQS